MGTTDDPKIGKTGNTKGFTSSQGRQLPGPKSYENGGGGRGRRESRPMDKSSPGPTNPHLPKKSK